MFEGRSEKWLMGSPEGASLRCATHEVPPGICSGTPEQVRFGQGTPSPSFLSNPVHSLIVSPVTFELGVKLPGVIPRFSRLNGKSHVCCLANREITLFSLC
jgi:hypothetical protein